MTSAPRDRPGPARVSDPAQLAVAAASGHVHATEEEVAAGEPVHGRELARERGGDRLRVAAIAELDPHALVLAVDSRGGDRLLDPQLAAAERVQPLRDRRADPGGAA